jgi:hypothetical protein
MSAQHRASDTMAAAHRNNLNKWHNDRPLYAPEILKRRVWRQTTSTATKRDVSSDTADEIPGSNSRASFVTVDYEEIS